MARKTIFMHGKTGVDFGPSTSSLSHSLFMLSRGDSRPLLKYQMELLGLRDTFFNGDDDYSWNQRVNLVRRTSLGKAALPHDKIYAIRAILQRGTEEDTFPLPDYDSNFNDLYWKTCVILMRRSKTGLTLIQDAGGSRNPSGIPSWVPDFNRPIQGFNSVLLSTRLFDFYPDFTTYPEFSLLDNDTKIATRAHLLTSVKGTINHNGLDTSFGTLKTDEERLCTTLSALECVRLWVKANNALNLPPASYYTWDPLQYLLFGTRYVMPDRFSRPIGFLELVDNADESTFDLEKFQVYLKASTGRRKTGLVRSTSGGAEVNTEALLSWNKEPKPNDAILKQRIRFWDSFRSLWDSCNGSRFLWTEDNGIGVSLPAARAGDVVALIPGLDWPMLLRRLANGNFSVVSPADVRYPTGVSLCLEEQLQDIVLE